MNGLYDTLREIGAFLGGQGWRWCIIGGLAVQQWGEPRTTLDADLTILAGIGEEQSFIDRLLAAFPSRIPDAAAFARANRVLLLQATNGKNLDVTFGALPFEEAMVERAARVDFAPGLTLPCCTAEDLFVMKVFAGRARDWSDAESIVARQTSLDKPYILPHLADLFQLKDAPDDLARARRLLEKAP